MAADQGRSLGLAACGCLLLALLGADCGRARPGKQVTIVDGVEVIVNPARPRHKNPGRVLKIEEKLRIRDTGDKFFFKYPAQPGLGPDGSVFIRDQHQLLRFSPDGAFLGNLYRPGQGPGEFQFLERLVIEGDELYAFDGPSFKIVRMTLDGRLLDDRRLGDWFVTITKNWIVGETVNLPKVMGVLADAKWNFYWISRADPIQKKTHVFLTRFFRKPPVVILLDWDKLRWVSDAKRDLLFVSPKREYGIEVLDLAAGRVVRSFSRDYSSVPYIVPENMKSVYAQGGTPKPDFEPDVLDLFLPDDSLWVRTSTVDPKKGQLFDIFNAQGDFLDSFFVPVKDKILGVQGETIFVNETAEDGTIAIVLYRNLEYRAASPH